MPKATSDKPKGRGTPVIGLRLTPEITEQLDAWAASQGINRSEAVRPLLTEALTRKRS